MVSKFSVTVKAATNVGRYTKGKRKILMICNWSSLESLSLQDGCNLLDIMQSFKAARERQHERCVFESVISIAPCR